MEMIDGPMILKFIEDSTEFEKYAEENFELITNKKSEQKVAAESMAMDNEELKDDDGVTAVDLEGYKSELKEMMTAVAKGIGNTPVNILVSGDGSLWLKVYEFEVSRIRKEEEKKKIEEEEEKKRESEKEKGNNNKKVEFIGVKKMKKKNSFDFLNFCGCSGKQFAATN